MRSAAKLLLAILIASASAPTPAVGRLSYLWTFSELAEKADAIVVAEPISTTSTAEKTELSENISPPVAVVGVETEFNVLAVLKGMVEKKEFVLHHYKLPPDVGVIINGPLLIDFPAESNVRSHYLMFSKRASDGRFEPVSGQVDPIDSIYRLSKRS